MRKGIDISYANGIVDFNKVKKAINFVIMRAGYGKNNIDAQFLRNVKECISLGIPFGVYWFSYALSAEEARMEAIYCIEAIKPYKEHLKWGVWFDLEYHSFDFAEGKGVTIDANAHAKAFLEEVKKAGYLAGNYTNKDFAVRIFNQEILSYPTWFAYYGNNSGAEPTHNVQHITMHSIWQYTSRGKIDGINGFVDVNIAYVDYANKATEVIAEPAKDEWVYDTKMNQWWYRYKDGTYPKDEWILLNDKWYYFDKGGWMAEGWIEYKGDWYYLQPRDGYMVEDVLLKLNDGSYYIKPDGKMARTNSSGALI